MKIEHKRSIHQARVGRGSPLCAKLCERIVSQLKDSQVAKDLGISPSTVIHT